MTNEDPSTETGTGTETTSTDAPAPGAVTVAEPTPAPATADAPAPTATGPEPALSALDAELDDARDAVYQAVAEWLSVTWEQPILRALGANASRTVEQADAFPALRRDLRALQAGARQTAKAGIAPLLGPDVQLRDQALISSVDAVVLQLAGLVGAALKDNGFDPLSGGLERVQDGFRLKTMTEHEQISGALRTYSGLKASRAAERAELIERERLHARAEVERLWHATADVD